MRSVAGRTVSTGSRVVGSSGPRSGTALPAGDPQLHTHVLVANCTRGADGRWSALDGQQLYGQAKTAGTLYQAALRWELRSLGLEWALRDNGLAEVAGIAPSILRGFSRRRVAIEAEMAAHGGTSRAAAQAATLATRTAKVAGVDAISLAVEWQTRADTLGLTPAMLHRLLGRTRPAPPAPLERDRIGGELLGADGLTGRRSTFTRKETLQGWASRLPAGAPVAAVEALTDGTLRDAETVALGAPVAPQPGAARSNRRHSTRELLAMERDLLALADEPLPAVPAVAPEVGQTLGRNLGQRAGTAPHDAAVTPRPRGLAALRDRLRLTRQARGPRLSREQRLMVEALLAPPRRVSVVVGKAGTGKTTALANAHQRWRHAGTPVLGCALAARAAVGLQDGSGIPSMSIARLTSLAQKMPLPAGVQLVVDEAGMVGTRTLHQLLTLVEAANGHLVLVGDHRQLPELAAGGAFAALARRPGTSTLTTNRRQTHAWERAALDQLRDGDPTLVVAAWTDHDQLAFHDTADASRAATVDAWADAALGGGTIDDGVVILAQRHADVAVLNTGARQRAVTAGYLRGPAVELGDGLTLAAGDLVLARRNDYAIGLVNGQRGRVIQVDLDATEVTVDFDGRTVRLLLGEDGRETLVHGYAMTVHHAQGLTVDTAIVYATDTLYREAGYVAASRARQGTTVNVTGHEPDDDLEHTHCPSHSAVAEAHLPTPPTRLALALRRSAAHEMASR